MPVRDTFWNIPHWAEIGQYILGLLVVLTFAYGTIRHARRWRMGQSERRSDQVGKRLWSVIVQGIGQLRTAREPFPGIMHLAIFWGMVALFMGTALATVDWDIAHLIFDSKLLKDGIYVVYELVLDILGLLLIVGLGIALWRRYVIRPARLEKMPGKGLTRDDILVLVLLVLVALTGYLVEGLRIAVVQPEWSAWSPVGKTVASLFVSLGDPTNRTLHLTLWFSHMLAAFAFIISIPFTKLFHLVAAPLNIFYRSLQPAGELAPMREDGEIGVSHWQEFTWKQLLDFDACIRCGRCQDNCPAFASGMTLSPRDVMVKLRLHMWSNGNGQALLGDVITADELWSCTTCQACVSACPVFTDQLASIVDMRRHLVIEGQLDVELQDALANLGRYGNSFGKSARMRARWSRARETKLKDARKEAVEYLWFLGDYASYSPALTAITERTADVFEGAGLDFGILYEGENNAGNDVRRVGEEGLFEMLVEKNVASFESASFRCIVTTDPHSYNTLRNEYPSLNGHHQVLHYSELLDQMIASGQIRFGKRLGYKVTYHDPCYLGRYNDVFDAPRRVIEATGCELVEMPRHGERSFCCGAGGGRIWMEEGDVTERASEARIREAVELDGVKAFVVACPKDVTMYRDAVKTTGYEDQLVVMDLIELVYEAL